MINGEDNPAFQVISFGGHGLSNPLALVLDNIQSCDASVAIRLKHHIHSFSVSLKEQSLVPSPLDLPTPLRREVGASGTLGDGFFRATALATSLVPVLTDQRYSLSQVFEV